jgi:RHS repeat-associated protein
MNFARILLLVTIGLCAVAHADTSSDVWNVTVTFTNAGSPPPLQGQVFKTLPQAEAAMKSATVDTPFLVQKETQTVASYGISLDTKYWIPPGDVATWGAWGYSGDSMVNGWNGCTSPVGTEGEVIDCTLGPRNPCGASTYLSNNDWYSEEASATYEREGRDYTLTVRLPTYDPDTHLPICGPYQTFTSASHIQRVRTKHCPSEAPWHSVTPYGDGTCRNNMTATITQNNVLGGCVPEPDRRSAVVGNPCDAGTGNKLQPEPDYRGAGLEFTRYYNSRLEFRSEAGMGDHWTHSYGTKLRFRTGSNGTVPMAYVVADGQAELFSTDYNSFVGERSGVILVQSGAEWELNLRDGGKQRFSAAGNLIWLENAVGQRTTITYGTFGPTAVTGPFGHALQFSYTSGRISSMTDPDGRVYQYSYDGNGTLNGVTYPDGGHRTYHYEDSGFPAGLTGITDENGDRYATFAYNSDWLVTSSQHAGGYQAYTLQYNSNATTTVTDARSNATTYSFASVLNYGSAGRRRPTTFTLNGQTFTRAYQQGIYGPHYVSSTTDENGVVTTYGFANYPTRLASRTEASGTAAPRTTSYQYLNAQRHLMNQITTPSVRNGFQRIVTIGYDTSQRPQTITVGGYTTTGTSISRVVALSYDSSGQITQIDGPRTDVSDVTTLTYNSCATGTQCGQLATVTNALGHVTTYNSYDGNGRLLQVTDPNGLVTSYTYDLRGRVTSITETPPAGSARVTSYTYDSVGQLLTATAANGTVLTYAYDTAHNLISVTDNSGNRIEYGYDLAGNRTSEDIKDPSSTLKKTLDYTYDVRNRIDTINSAGSVTDVVFDALGNLTGDTDPNMHGATHQYDPFYRLKKTTDALSGNTEYTYAVNDTPATVKAPNGATTTYVYDDLGNLRSEASPDRGTTTYTYDAAGNRLTQADANGNTTTYTYDALNRVTFVDYAGSGLDVTLAYDQNTAQKGRLTTMTDGAGTTELTYDVFGNVTQESKTIDGNMHVTAYTYDAANLLTGITYPSGRTVAYTRNVLGQVTAVDTSYGGSNATVASSITYQPFGPLSGLTFGNSLAMARTFDQQYRLTDQTTGAVQDVSFTLDAAGNIDATTDGVNAGLSQGFDQDALDRLTTEAGSYGTQTYTYDGSGNRLTRVHGATTQTLTYTANSNRLVTHDGNTVSRDAAGNTTIDPAENVSFTYGTHNRMLSAHMGGVLKASYVYNGRGQRVKKVEATGSNRTLVYHYGLGGELLGETVYASGGAKIGERDYLWLDSLPLAQSERVYSGGTLTSSTFVYLHADQLNTPRLATNATGTVVWRWDSDAFGVGAANLDPDGDTNQVSVRLRFPGQYLDEETGLAYNYFRDYDAVTGRYVESDPIGIGGGVNTFAYVNANPLIYVDPYGLYSFDDFVNDSANFSAGWGDMLSFGITARIRQGFDIGSVDKCSASYKGGEMFGFANGLALGWAQGSKAVAKAASSNNWANFSHTLLPKRFLKQLDGPFAKWLNKAGNRLNGDYVSPELHTRMDAAAQFGLSREWLAANPLFSPMRQLINKMPYIPGTAAYGVGSAAMNSCGCQN